uniref:Uncharacterized protein n=1 Tax=Buteo japonicus TaxID=224669 RepID=A0A8C0BK38_9AVES
MPPHGGGATAYIPLHGTTRPQLSHAPPHNKTPPPFPPQTPAPPPSGDEVGALVFDIGSFSVRAGYAGEDCPKVGVTMRPGPPTPPPSPSTTATSSSKVKGWGHRRGVCGQVGQGRGPDAGVLVVVTHQWPP